MDLIQGSRGVYSLYRQFDLQARDYFDFPITALAFGTSLKGSTFVMDAGVFFRARGKILTLITWFCDNAILLNVVEKYTALGYTIKTLNFVNKPFDGLTKTSYGLEFRSSKRWDGLLGDMSARMRGSIRHGGSLYEIDPKRPSRDEIYRVFDEWVSWAKPRHFMLVTGHYKSFIELNLGGAESTQIIGFREKATGTLVAIVGFEVWKEKAVTVLFKHRPLHSSAAHFFWLSLVRYINEEYGIEDIFQGSTCDELKRALRFDEFKSYKLRLSEKEVKDE